MQLVWLFVLIGAAVTQGESTGASTGTYAKTCAPPLGKQPFNADRGIWYTVAIDITPPELSRDWKLGCAKINYTVTRTVNATELLVVADLKGKSGSIHRVEMRAKELWSWGTWDSATSQVVWRVNSSWTDVGQHSVLNTDYDTYAIIQVCAIIHEEDEFKRFQVTEVLSRQPTMDAGKLKVLKSVASSSDVDETKFKDIDNSACE